MLFWHKNSTNESSDMNNNRSLNGTDGQDNERNSTYPLPTNISESVDHSDDIASNQDTLGAKDEITQLDHTSLVRTPSVAVSETSIQIKYSIY